MKKFLTTISFVLFVLTASAQYYTPHYYSYKNHYTSPFNEKYKNGFKYSYPINCAFTLGQTFINGVQPRYGETTLKKNYLTIGAKICGLICTFGSNIEFLNESVYGYWKVLQGNYLKFGIELGKLYFTKNNKIHSFSIAPTYTIINYSIYDTSGNSIGWSNYDNLKRQEFYSEYKDYRSIGINFNYNYQYFGIDLSISKNVVEISLVLQLDMTLWIHNLIHGNF